MNKEPLPEPVATLHDDGYWTPEKTEAGRNLNTGLSYAGTRTAVFTAAQLTDYADRRCAERDAEIEQLRELLDEAASDVEYWFQYAGDHLTCKHKIEDDIARYRAALKGAP